MKKILKIDQYMMKNEDTTKSWWLTFLPPSRQELLDGVDNAGFHQPKPTFSRCSLASHSRSSFAGSSSTSLAVTSAVTSASVSSHCEARSTLLEAAANIKDQVRARLWKLARSTAASSYFFWGSVGRGVSAFGRKSELLPKKFEYSYSELCCSLPYWRINVTINSSEAVAVINMAISIYENQHPTVYELCEGVVARVL